jgi:hypothetical protein
MDYSYAVKTTKNTAKADAIETELKLTAGIITQVWMVHPEGCQGLAYAAIFRGGHQLYPANPEEAYHGNDVPMIWDDNYELETPAVLKLKTWNLDDTYDHTVYVRVTVMRPIIDVATQALIDALNIIKQLLTGRRVS